MTCCPACGDSRWVYPRQHALGGAIKSFAGWYPYKCQSCGWRGWCRSFTARDDTPTGNSPESAPGSVVPRLADVQLMAADVFRSLEQRVAPGVRRLAARRPLTRLSLAMWLIALVAVGLLVVGVQFSAQKPTSESSAFAPAAPSSPSIQQPVESPSPSVERASLSEPPAVMPAADVAPVEARASAVAMKPSVAPDLTSARPVAAVRPTAQRAAVAAPAAAHSPKYRGSLAITSEPSGALVVVDGQAIGSTPVVVRDVRAGSRVVRIESSGYEPWSTAARVVADKETRVNATLQRGSQQ